MKRKTVNSYLVKNFSLNSFVSVSHWQWKRDKEINKFNWPSKNSKPKQTHALICFQTGSYIINVHSSMVITWQPSMHFALKYIAVYREVHAQQPGSSEFSGQDSGFCLSLARWAHQVSWENLFSLPPSFPKLENLPSHPNLPHPTPPYLTLFSLLLKLLEEEE